MLYVSENPIDDQSNHHLPVAQLTALHANINREKGRKPFGIVDFLLFHKQDKPDQNDLEQQILSGDW